jgi:hypothetical protein
MHIQAHTDETFYEVFTEMDSGVMVYIPSFIKFVPRIQVCMRGGGKGEYKDNDYGKGKFVPVLN